MAPGKFPGEVELLKEPCGPEYDLIHEGKKGGSEGRSKQGG